MINLSMSGGGQFVDRSAVALVATPQGTESWHPVPHIDVIDTVTEVVKAHNWTIMEEQYGLARDGQKLFGVIRLNKSSSLEWSRCIGLRNSHDRSFAVGLSAGINVMVCSNLAFGGTAVLKRRHTSRIELAELVNRVVDELEDQFLPLENVCEDLKLIYLRNDDEARSVIVKAAELGAINSSDILPVYQEFKSPRHDAFAEPTRWSLLNAMTETVKKYTPQRVDRAYCALNTAFGLDGRKPLLWS
ncbi:MAG: DUF932 domain-containing protein [Lentisphaeria bacterium]|nr:DUF932 domain-containing protein [Lentisphaeria bacterium]